MITFSKSLRTLYPYSSLDAFTLAVARCWLSTDSVLPSTSTSSSSTGSTSQSARARPLVSVALLGPPNVGKSTLFNACRLKGNQALSSGNHSGFLKSKKKISGRLLQTHPQKKHQHVQGTAIVSSVPGTTRDARTTHGKIGEVEFVLIDTAGIDTRRQESYHHSTIKSDWKQMALQQTQHMAQHADVVFLIIDGKVPHLTSDVWETAHQLRKTFSRDDADAEDHHRRHCRRMIRVLVNKMEGLVFGEYPPIMEEAARLGFGEPIPISAIHGDGVAELASIIHQQQQIKYELEDPQEIDTTNEMEKPPPINKNLETRPLRLAILGRVNSGKSTLVNQLMNLNEFNGNDGVPGIKQSKDDSDRSACRRVITGPKPGLTRDSIRLRLTWDNGKIVDVIDTAGIRKTLTQPIASVSGRRHVEDSDEIVESWAVQEAWYACKTADVVALVIDAGAKTLQRSELGICNAILQEGRALVVVANKMDLVVETGYSIRNFSDDVRDRLETRFPILRKTPIVAMSALNGKNVDKLLPVVWDARERWQQRISTAQLNRWIRDVQTLQPHPAPTLVMKNKKKSKSASVENNSLRAKIKYMIQTKGRPPSFLLYCNTDTLPDSYVRFLTRHFQDTFSFYGMPLRIAVKQSSNPFANRSKSSKQSAASSHGIGGRQRRFERKTALLKKAAGKIKAA